MSEKSVKIYVSSKMVGAVVENVFYKEIIGSKHILLKPLSICNDVQVLMDAKKAGAVFVQVYDKESGELYCTTIETILKDGFYFDRDYNKQVGLPLARWTEKLNDQA